VFCVLLLTVILDNGNVFVVVAAAAADTGAIGIRKQYYKKVVRVLAD